MITNIIAVITVCIVTNVTTTDNAVIGEEYWNNRNIILCSTYTTGDEMDAGKNIMTDKVWTNTPYYMSFNGRATEKTETTEVVEVKTIKFAWEGQEYTGKRERVLSRKVRKWRLCEDWVEQAESEG